MTIATDEPRVLFSHDIFVSQAHGGMSRLFVGLHRALLARGVHSLVAAGLHINAGLSGQPRVTGLRMPGGGSSVLRRGYRLCNLAFDRAMTAAWSPSIYHLTYFPRRTDPVSVPIAVTVPDMIHELHPSHVPANDRTSERKRYWTKSAHVVFAISEQTKQDLVALFSVPEDKVTVVYPGLTPLPPDPDLDVRAYGDYLLYVGARGVAYKNFPALIAAWARSEEAQALNLVCFGGGPLTGDEEELFRKLGMLSRLHILHGSDAQLAAVYAGARALAYPSLYEGFGFPPLEAMAAGCPVACSGRGSLPEVVGDAALLFDPDDVDEMAAALDRIVFDSALQSRLVAAGTARAASFTWDRAAAQTVEAYLRA